MGDFCDFFRAIKSFCLPFQVAFTDRNDRFPYPFLYFNKLNPNPFIYLKPEKGTPFGQSLPVQVMQLSTIFSRSGYALQWVDLPPRQILQGFLFMHKISSRVVCVINGNPCILCILLGTSRSDDAMATTTSKQTNKQTIGQEGITTTLQVHHTFLYISLPFLHDYDVKFPNWTFHGGRKQATTKFYFSFS